MGSFQVSHGLFYFCLPLGEKIPKGYGGYDHSLLCFYEGKFYSESGFDSGIQARLLRLKRGSRILYRTHLLKLLWAGFAKKEDLTPWLMKTLG